MARMKKLLVFVLFLLASGIARASSTLDIGTEYRLRTLSYSKADYGLTSNQKLFPVLLATRTGSYWRKVSPNLEFMTQFQALSVAGSSATTISIQSLTRRQPLSEHQFFTMASMGVYESQSAL